MFKIKLVASENITVKLYNNIVVMVSFLNALIILLVEKHNCNETIILKYSRNYCLKYIVLSYSKPTPSSL